MLCPLCHADNPEGAEVCRSCGVALVDTGVVSPTLWPGTALQNGTYIVDRVLGQGGFGITYLATDTLLKRAICLKEFFPAHCHRHSGSVHPFGPYSTNDFREARQRFIDEARTLARFSHPGIVNVHTCFQENNTAYVVMEYLQGRSLRDVLEDECPLSEEWAVHYVGNAGLALEAVHNGGYLHRDIKPENIMVTNQGRVLLIDFGTARDVNASQARGHTVAVTPGYAPLEQYAQRAQRGAYTDVYALGATLYHLVTGEVPSAAPDRVAGVELREPKSLNSAISPHVNNAIMWAMELKIDDRPQAVRDFLHALKDSHTLAVQVKNRISREDSERQNGKLQRSLDQQLAAQVPFARFNSFLDSLFGKQEAPSVKPATHKRSDQFSIEVRTPRAQWPSMCACCGTTATPTATLAPCPGFTKTTREMYCSNCALHVHAFINFRILVAVEFVAVIPLSILLAVFSRSPLMTLLVLLPVFLLLYMNLRARFARLLSKLGPDCAGHGPAVTGGMVNSSGHTYLTFDNQEYAEEFERQNAGDVVRIWPRRRR